MIGFDLVVFEGKVLLKHPVSHHVAALQGWRCQSAFAHHDRSGTKVVPWIIRLIHEGPGHGSDGAPILRVLRAEDHVPPEPMECPARNTEPRLTGYSFSTISRTLMTSFSLSSSVCSASGVTPALCLAAASAWPKTAGSRRGVPYAPNGL